jgi:hypothetical protein
MQRAILQADIIDILLQEGGGRGRREGGREGEGGGERIRIYHL